MELTGRKLNEDIEKIQSLMEMAIADKVELGFPYFAYISGKHGVNHGPRVKFAEIASNLKVYSESFSVSISGNPKIVAGEAKNALAEQRAIEWVRKNHDVLMLYWDDPIQFGSTKIFLQILTPI